MTSVGVLDKVMAILDAFADGSTRLDPAAVATRVGVSTPTAYRLMGAMAQHRLLDVDGRTYGLGSKLLELGSRAHRGVDVRAAALPHLRHLSTESAETVELQIRTGHRRVPIEMIVGSRTVRTAGELGVPLPVHVGASSRVLLAWLDEEQAMRLARESADELPDHPWDPEQYLTRLRLVREQGWEYSRGERDPETSAVSAPVRDRNGYVVAAVVVSSTLTRLADEAHRTAVIDLVRTAAHAISTDLGHHTDAPLEATP
ncbi:IclR family transcriptional regulator [Ornithinimicrobium cavernae]|uniref:IclR family transcriptional regulator n=1 Tax=Ornithinimicrobium cavernae TaxID=2666047 RepID=UPI000D692BD4|nr:IclR family transcriptional regulator [Ornithinimicrobium cavernae]